MTKEEIVCASIFIIIHVVIYISIVLSFQNQKISELQKELNFIQRKESQNFEIINSEKNFSTQILNPYYVEPSPQQNICVSPIENTQKNPEYLFTGLEQKFQPKKTLPFESQSINNYINSNDEIQNIEINDDFSKALRLFETTNNCVFITGKAGTGKSTLLRYLVANTKKQIVVLAYTGIAALNVKGETIHSFFKFPPRPLTDDDIRESPFREIYKKIDTIVIDEISMVRADLLDAIDKFLRINGRAPNEPFGGIQMLFFGDLYQLSPIVADKEEALFLNQNYQSPWFFDSNVMKSHPYTTIELTKVYRQTDHEFIDLLDSIRTGKYNEAHLTKLNKRFQVQLNQNNGSIKITLTSTNKLAHQINEKNLRQLDSPEITFIGTINGEFPKKTLPTETVLKLKQGAQVMFIKNDINHRWVNGTMGKIVHLSNDELFVEVFENGTRSIFSVAQEKWEIHKYFYDIVSNRLETQVVGSFIQIPLKLAWAVTIHKSQGLTFNQVTIDLGNGAFSTGQTYVALSRCRTLEGIELKRRIDESDIRVDPNVIRFYSNMKPYN